MSATSAALSRVQSRSTNRAQPSHTVPAAAPRPTRLMREVPTPTTTLPHLRLPTAGTMRRPSATRAAGLSAFQFPTSFCASRQEGTATFDDGRPACGSPTTSSNDEHATSTVDDEEIDVEKRRSITVDQELSALRRQHTSELEALPLASLLRRRSTAVPLLPDHVDPQPLMEVQEHQTSEELTFSIASDSAGHQSSSVIAGADQYRFAPFPSLAQRFAHVAGDEYPASLMLWRHAVACSSFTKNVDRTQSPRRMVGVADARASPPPNFVVRSTRKSDVVLLEEHRSAMNDLKDRMERNPSLVLEHRLLVKASESQCARGRLKALDAAHEARRLARWKVRIEESVLLHISEEAYCRCEMIRDEALQWTRLRRAAEGEHLRLQAHALAFDERTAREILRLGEESCRACLNELEDDHRRRSLLKQRCREAVGAWRRAEPGARLTVTNGEADERHALACIEHVRRHDVLLLELVRDEVRERELVAQFYDDCCEKLTARMSASWRASKERECNRIARDAFARGVLELSAEELAHRQVLSTVWLDEWREISSTSAAMALAIRVREGLMELERETRAGILNSLAVELDVLTLLWRTSVMEAEQRGLLRGEEVARRLLQRDVTECHEHLVILEARGRSDALRREDERRRKEQETLQQCHLRERAHFTANAHALLQSIRDDEVQAFLCILRQRSEERDELLRREQEAATARAFRQRALSSAPFLGFSLAEKVAPASAAEKRLVHDAQIANLVVDSLVIGGPAHAQGMQLNDIIVSVGSGVKPTSLAAVRQAIASGAKVGQVFEVIVKRKKSSAPASSSLDDTGRSLVEVDFKRLLEEDDAASVASEETGSLMDHPNSVRHAYDTLVFHIPVKTVLPEFSSLSDLFFDVTKAHRVERENPTPGYTTRTRRAFTEKLGASPYLSPQQAPRPTVSPSTKSPSSLPNSQGRAGSGATIVSGSRSVSPHGEPVPLSRLQTARPTELGSKRAAGPESDSSS